MKIGLMGGTFDPIHIGHLLAAERAREEAGLDEVWFMPVRVPPHKRNAPLASPGQRLAMVDLAVENHPGFKSVDLELHRGGTSYTVDTVEELRNRYSREDFYYIIGADMVMFLPNWYKIGELAEKITFIGLARPGYQLRLDELGSPLKEKVRIVPMPQVDISSTDIRARRKAGRSIRYLVNEPVREYIEVNRLYES